ncbi:hypothetical protein [Geopseudomonas aromaticivorans]
MTLDDIRSHEVIYVAAMRLLRIQVEDGEIALTLTGLCDAESNSLETVFAVDEGRALRFPDVGFTVGLAELLDDPAIVRRRLRGHLEDIHPIAEEASA